MADYLIWAIVAASAAAVMARAFGLTEAFWAVLGAALLVALGLLPRLDARRAVAGGADVYLFLTGMMLLSEVARREGLFDWLAALAVAWARGSSRRLFVLIYLVGAVVIAEAQLPPERVARREPKARQRFGRSTAATCWVYLRKASINSSLVSPACLSTPDSVPTFNSRWLGTTHPVAPRRRTI